MADPIQELLQAGAVDPDQLAALLREQRGVGTAGILSGSKRVAPLGAELRSEAVDTAAGLGQQAQKSALEQWRAQMQALSREQDRQARAREGALNRRSREGIASQNRDAITARMKFKAGGADVDPEAMMLQADDIGRLADIAGKGREQSGFFSTGVFSHTQGIGGTPAANLFQRLQPLRSQAALGKLAELKQQSRTGASGLGSVTEKEIDLLMSAFASLDQAQSEEQLDEALQEIETRYRNISRQVREAAMRGGQRGGDSDGSLESLFLQLDSDDDDSVTQYEGDGGY